MKRFFLLALFILPVFGGGLLIGTVSKPDGWYAALAKPPFNPPDWIFAPVWSLLYVMIGVAGWRTFERAPQGRAMALWGVQLALNFAWSPVFFGAHRPGLSLAVIALLMCAILGFMAAQWSRDRAAAWLFAPYALWVGFATLLNGAIVWLNP